MEGRGVPRAEGHEVGVPSQFLGQESVVLVAAVETDFFSQQAGGYG